MRRDPLKPVSHCHNAGTYQYSTEDFPRCAKCNERCYLEFDEPYVIKKTDELHIVTDLFLRLTANTFKFDKLLSPCCLVGVYKDRKNGPPKCSKCRGIPSYLIGIIHAENETLCYCFDMRHVDSDIWQCNVCGKKWFVTRNEYCEGG